MSGIVEKLEELRSFGEGRRTVGLSDEQIEAFASDAALDAVVDRAIEVHRAMRVKYADLLALDEATLCERVQGDFVNFYDAANVNPYVALAAQGPWVVTSHGAVLHDSGGYGMLGAGHAPEPVLDTMAEPWVMANIMTPSVSHLRFSQALRREVGHNRPDQPFARFLAMNSGSESVTVALRISDINAAQLAGDGGPKAGRTVKLLAVRGGFHGRTDRPAQASDSSLPKYRKLLYSFQHRDNLLTVPPNDVAALEAAFAQAERDGVFIESMLVEPVMGEGNPGMAMTRAFYDAARRLTKAHGSFLLIDSIQAGLRATGNLSIVDYPGFEDAEPPDMETYSKALNAGQYPMSILALGQRAVDVFQRGVYGNTMTANPRALEVATTVLEGITPELRANIVARGHELVAKLEALKAEFPDLVLGVQGTGLLVSCEINHAIPVVGFGGLEEHCRVHGLGVIHGGTNSLRFTPHFAITSAELDLVCEVLRASLEAFQLDAMATTTRVTEVTRA
ncbi:MAG: aminotransferase class III-fold pyridoxal phosphate-dependent enzyme [Alphaproteobacteria bacterium]|nr:aminotransferase class III-fold pyridoxal phosphate-dependent enzyme [Alphaproteobacteria bacterium]